MTDSSCRRSILADLSKEAFFDQKELFRSLLIRLFSSLSVDSSMTETEWWNDFRSEKKWFFFNFLTFNRLEYSKKYVSTLNGF